MSYISVILIGLGCGGIGFLFGSFFAVRNSRLLILGALYDYFTTEAEKSTEEALKLTSGILSYSMVNKAIDVYRVLTYREGIDVGRFMAFVDNCADDILKSKKERGDHGGPV